MNTPPSSSLFRPISGSDREAIPADILAAASKALPHGEVILGVFIIPADVYRQGFRWRLMPEQVLVFTQSGVLHLVNDRPPKKTPVYRPAAWLPATHIQRIKMSLVLLYGKLEIWDDTPAHTAKIEVQYNTVTQRILSPLLKSLVAQTWQPNAGRFEHVPSDESFSQFFKTSFSFYNGLTGEALQETERILDWVYQPEIRQPRLHFFYRRLFPQTVAVFTDRQIILLQEDLAYRQHYEWIFTFIPWHRVSHLSDQPAGENTRATIHLRPVEHKHTIDLLFEPSNTETWHKICRRLELGTE